MFSRSAESSRSPGVQHQAFRMLTVMLQSSPENQCCADCTSRLMDSIWASTTLGAFLCIHCAGAHRKLGVQLSRVKSLHLDTWTDDEVAAMKGGNKSVNEIYSKYVDQWIQADASLELLPNTATDVREKCIRAKYQDKQFTKLPHMFEKERSPENPEERTSTASSGSSSPIDKDHLHDQHVKNGEPAVIKAGSVVEVTKRFLNYFFVVGRGAIAPDQSIEKTKSPTDIRFLPTVLDVFPDAYVDSPPAAHLGDFAFPEGFVLSKSYVAPVFFSFVLTNVSGVKIYACALKFYEELHPLEVVSLIAPHYHRQRHRQKTSDMPSQSDESDDNQQTQLPKWIQDLSGDAARAPDPVFCPKCIAVTSHYPYFSAFRQFLQQIYRVSLSESPMPIERYIANFLIEIPLPPPGQIQVQLTLPDRNLIISRPPKNELPLVDFPFRPLFQVLDLNNVLLVFSCLALELKVVLCSKHVGLLTPVAEALMAILLPFSWQGAYIPVLPISLLDVIDAPVPFLVGTHSDCLKQLAGQTTNVVFVDLDHNRVIPAVDDSGRSIAIPKLPEREGSKLRSKLAAAATIFDPYAAGISRVDLAFPNEEHLEPIGNFASDHGQTVPLSTSYSESSMADSLNSLTPLGRAKRGRRSSAAFSLAFSSQATSPSASFSRTNSFRHSFSFSVSAMPPTGNGSTGTLTESRYNEAEDFSAEGVRKAFLRFFVTLLKKYASYLNPPSTASVKSGGQQLFDSKRFLQDNFDAAARPFVSSLIATQMFDRFIEDRVFNQQLPEVLFFDQSINQKLNRSLTLGKKKFDCSFLENCSDDIQETFIAPPPSNIGLPDDGTIYKYKAFPRLKRALFGNVRKPRELFTSREQQRNVSRVTFHQGMFKTGIGRSYISTGVSWEATRHLIISLQTQFRMYIARKKYRRQREAAIAIQRQVIARIKRKSDRQHFIALRSGAIQIQKICRMRQAMAKYRSQHRALLKLQFVARGYIVSARYQRISRGFRCLQALWRGSFYKCSYQALRLQVVRVQSCVRGFISRRYTTRLKAALFETCRQKVYKLWDHQNTPLLYRSQFWIQFKQPDFLAIGIYHQEEARLAASFGDERCNSDKLQPTKTTHGASTKRDELRASTLVAFKRLINVKPEMQKTVNDLGAKRMKAERGKVYAGLKSHSNVKDRSGYYEKFAIAQDSKKKKKRLSTLVWTNIETADVSAEIVVSALASSEEAEATNIQVDQQKQRRLRDDLAFTVNAGFKSIRSSAISVPQLQSLAHPPANRNLIELQRQLCMLMQQNQQLSSELAASKRKAKELQLSLQKNEEAPQLERAHSNKI